MDEPKIVMHDEVQLLDWGESRATGAWIKLRLPDPDLLDVFRGMDTATLKKTGHIMSCTLAEGDITQLAEQHRDDKPIYGGWWRDLIASGFFRGPLVLKAIAPERDFESWIRTMPSVLDGAMDWDTERGEHRNECCHVRRVSQGSGTAERPPYFAVPMTHEQHHHQHQKGENAALARWGSVPEEGAEHFFTMAADRMRAEWASKALAKKLMPGCKSRGDVSPEQVRSWVYNEGLWQYLPDRLRKAS